MKLGFCALCGSTDNLEHHHVLPRSLGGTDDEDNLLTLCATHHIKVHALSERRIQSAELIKEAKAKQKEQGIFLGGHVPFGYSVRNDKLVKNNKQLKILSEIEQQRSNGMSLRQIQKWLLETHNLKRSHSWVAGVSDGRTV